MQAVFIEEGGIIKNLGVRKGFFQLLALTGTKVTFHTRSPQDKIEVTKSKSGYRIDFDVQTNEGIDFKIHEQ